MRVLVVEDESRLAENIAKALREGPQFAVDLAYDAHEARVLWESYDYDGVVLDLMLPGGGGADTCGHARQCCDDARSDPYCGKRDTARD